MTRRFYAKNRYWFIIDINGKECIKFYNLIKFSIYRKQTRLIHHCEKREKEIFFEEIKRQETLILDEYKWCKKYNLTRNQYFRHKRILQK
jgi:hypothetical protein